MQHDIVRAKTEEERCIAFDGQNNPCQLRKVDGSEYCPKHGSPANIEKKKIYNYRLTVFKGRLGQKMDSDAILSLREEIGIARITLEEVLNQCQTATDLLINQQRIVTLVTAIQRTVESCQKVEAKTGHLLSKSQLISFAQSVINIVSAHVTDAPTQRLIADQIVATVEEVADIDGNNE